MWWQACMETPRTWVRGSASSSSFSCLLLASLCCSLMNSYRRWGSFETYLRELEILKGYLQMEQHVLYGWLVADGWNNLLMYISGLWTWLWYLPLHCHQHLWDHCVEGLLTCHCQHWSWHRVWGCGHRSFPPSRYKTRQGKTWAFSEASMNLQSF